MRTRATLVLAGSLVGLTACGLALGARGQAQDLLPVEAPTSLAPTLPGPHDPTLPVEAGADEGDPEQAAQDLQDRFRRELDASIERYKREAEALRARLAKVESALERLSQVRYAIEAGGIKPGVSPEAIPQDGGGPPDRRPGSFRRPAAPALSPFDLPPSTPPEEQPSPAGPGHPGLDPPPSAEPAPELGPTPRQPEANTRRRAPSADPPSLPNARRSPFDLDTEPAPVRPSPSAPATNPDEGGELQALDRQIRELTGRRDALLRRQAAR